MNSEAIRRRRKSWIPNGGRGLECPIMVVPRDWSNRAAIRFLGDEYAERMVRGPVNQEGDVPSPCRLPDEDSKWLLG